MASSALLGTEELTERLAVAIKQSEEYDMFFPYLAAHPLNGTLKDQNAKEPQPLGPRFSLPVYSAEYFMLEHFQTYDGLIPLIHNQMITVEQRIKYMDKLLSLWDADWYFLFAFVTCSVTPRELVVSAYEGDELKRWWSKKMEKKDRWAELRKMAGECALGNGHRIYRGIEDIREQKWSLPGHHNCDPFEGYTRDGRTWYSYLWR